MLKINSKKKSQKNSILTKPSPIAKKLIVRPEWNSTQSDLGQYKLSQTELVIYPLYGLKKE